MQIVRRDSIGGWSLRVIKRGPGHYLLMQHASALKIPVIKFLAEDFGQSMRAVDRIIERETGVNVS